MKMLSHTLPKHQPWVCTGELTVTQSTWTRWHMNTVQALHPSVALLTCDSPGKVWMEHSSQYGHGTVRKYIHQNLSIRHSEAHVLTAANSEFMFKNQQWPTPSVIHIPVDTGTPIWATPDNTCTRKTNGKNEEGHEAQRNATSSRTRDKHKAVEKGSIIRATFMFPATHQP